MLQSTLPTVQTGPTQIQYIAVTTGNSVEKNEFYKSAFRMLMVFPVNLLQLENPLRYFDLSYKLNYKRGTNLFLLTEDIIGADIKKNAEILEIYSSLFNDDLIKVFLIDPKIMKHEYLAKTLAELPFCYYSIIGDISPDNKLFYGAKNLIIQYNDLIRVIIRDIKAINIELKRLTSYEIGELNFGTNEFIPKLNPEYGTHLALANYCLLNQMLGNIWRPNPSQSEIASTPEKRVEIQIDQCKAIDELHWESHQGKFITPIEAKNPSLIIIAPYHFPKTDNLSIPTILTSKQKAIKKAYKSEQNIDYTFLVDEDELKPLERREIVTVLTALTSNLVFLDTVAYFHAQFNFSPIFRLPIIGKSINADLSHFLKSFSIKQKAVRKMGALGKKLCTSLIDPRLKNLLIQRDSQMVFISDLPMEWLQLKEYPISLTHDVCRIPEFNHNSLLNNFIHNQRTNFKITPKILQKTLVIHSASDDDKGMNKCFAMIDSYKDKLGFNSVYCNTIDQIKTAIDNYKPDLLIFDCHGNYDSDTLSTYLDIDHKNGVRLTGDDIVKHGISAPLVFISACSTQPSYGFVKYISDAFFQAGALAVTATYVPILMIDATVVVIRILNNLNTLKDIVIHNNWLAFISHTLRGALIFDAINTQKGKIPASYDEKVIGNILAEMMIFENRVRAFNKIKAYLKSLNASINIDFENLNNEWLSYTTLGRADLIYFENWEKKHTTKQIEELEK